MNKKLISGIVVVVVVILIVWGVSGKQQSADKPVRIGAGLLLTGPAALVGELQRNGVTLAAEHINAAGGINGRPLELVIEDFTYDPKIAISAYQKMKLQGLRNYIVDGSPLLSAMHQLFVNDNNFNIAAVAYAPAYFDGDNRTCRIGLTAKSLGVAMSDLAFARGYKKVAVIAEDNEKGRSLIQEFLKSYEARGGQVVLAEYFWAGAGTGDFRTSIAKIKNAQSQVDAIVFTNALNTILPMIKQMRDQGITKPLISDTSTLDNPAFKGDLSPLNGTEYPSYEYMNVASATDSAEVKVFKAAYKAKYNTDAPYIAAGHYDITKLLAEAIGKVGEDPQKIANYISGLKNHKGITGTFSFDSDCEVSRPSVFYKVQDGKVVRTN